MTPFLKNICKTECLSKIYTKFIYFYGFWITKTQFFEVVQSSCFVHLFSTLLQYICERVNGCFHKSGKEEEIINRNHKVGLQK